MEIRSSTNYIWNVKDILGQGATGAVYKGRHKKTGDVFAVKTSNHLGMMRPVEVRKREFDILSKLDHENIVKIFASETELRSQYEIIVMELCPGGSLFTMLEHPSNSQGFSEQDCFNVIRDVVAGMKHLHDMGMVHRDLKPGNIMRVYKDDGRCVYKLTDFGAARELMASDQFVSIYGTEEYLHPDLYERGVLRKPSGKTFGAQVDLWSIGVTFYHIATGKLPFRPFGGRQNKDVMYHITSKKSSGMIAGVQMKDGGDVVWSDKLPDENQLSQGFKDLLTPVLAGVLECNPAKMMTFNQFFTLIQDMITRKVIDVYSVSSSAFYKIYIKPSETYVRFQEMIAEQTGLHPDHQQLYFNFESFQPLVSAPASTYPFTSRDKPMILIGGEFIGPERLKTRRILDVPKLPNEWTLEGDATAAKIMANCAYSCEHSVQLYSDSIKVMADTIDTVITCSRRGLLEHNSTCKDVESRRMAVQQMTAVYCASQENTLLMLTDLMSKVNFTLAEKAAIDKDASTIKEMTATKRMTDETQAKEANEWLTPLKAMIRDRLDNNPMTLDAARFFQLANRKPLLPVVSTCKTRIEDTYNRFRKEKHQRRLSHFDDQNHVFDRKKLSADCDKVKDMTNECATHRAAVHGELHAWFSRVKRYEERVFHLLQQCYEIRVRDDVHLKTMKKFQEESEAILRTIVQRIKSAMAASAVSSVGTDPPSMSVHVNGVSSQQETDDAFWFELEDQISNLSRVTETSKATAMENAEQLKQLTSSFNEFFQVIDESGRQSLEELQKLASVESY